VSASGRHIIHTVRLELSSDLNTAFRQDLPSKAGQVLRRQLPDMLEPLFAEFGSSKHVVFDRMEISLGALPVDRFEEVMLDKLRSKMTAAMASAASGSNPAARILSDKGYRYERMVHFLTTGSLPWFASDSDRAGAAGSSMTGRISQKSGTPADLTGECTWAIRKMPGKLTSFLQSRLHDKAVLSRTLALYHPRPAELFEMLMPGQEQQASDFYALIKANTDARSLDNLNVTYLQALLAAGSRKPFWMTVLSFFLLLDRAGQPLPARLISAICDRDARGGGSKSGNRKLPGKADLEKISEALNRIRDTDRAGQRTEKESDAAQGIVSGRLGNALLQELSAAKGTAVSTRKKRPDGTENAEAYSRREIDELLQRIRSARYHEREAARGSGAEGQAEAGAGVSADSVVRNAGLVLFWPFLPRYFSVLELIEGGDFVDARSRMKAMQLLGYLESGEDQLPEYRMALIKLLCGHPSTGPLEHPVPLGMRDKKEAVSLLESVIAHWKVLKSTSVDGFRESFIRRDGLLRQSDRSWKLLVERKPYDMLLDKLPWSYSIVKLPWMDSEITVEW
jgi:hypothetical protein